MTKIEHLDDTTFTSALQNAGRPVLVDFYADWCGPCRGLAPVLEEIAVQYQGKLQVGKVNVDTAPRLAAQYGVRSIPTMIIFRDGQEVDRVTGALPKQELAAYIDSLHL